jgi:hypothetical protein
LNGSTGKQTACPAALDAWIKNSRASVPAGVIAKAKQAINRVLSPPSEFIEPGIWKNSDHFDAWRRAVEGLLARL